MPVADWLAQGHDVGDNTLRLKHPEVCACAAEAGLHFIRDADSSGGADRSKGFAQVSRRQNDLTATTQRRLAEEGSKTVAIISDLPHCLSHVAREELAGVGSTMGATIDIRLWNLAHPGGTTSTALAVELVRAEINHRAGVAVISGVHYDHFIPPGVRACQTQRQLVRFTAATNQVHDTQWLRQHCSQPLAVIDQVFMQIAGIRIENRHLLGSGTHYVWMAVSDMRDIINAVQVAPTVGIIKILA